MPMNGIPLSVVPTNPAPQRIPSFAVTTTLTWSRLAVCLWWSRLHTATGEFHRMVRFTFASGNSDQVE
jgi:hypothetical protein